MSTWLAVILEIIKITIPALIVFLTVFYLFKSFFAGQYQLKLLEGRQNERSITTPLRLQAYERLALLCERISIPTLVLRMREDGQTCASLRLALFLAIQQEFEYNVTQQVYVSDQLWQIIKIARDETITIVDGMAEKFDPQAPGSDLAAALVQFVEKHPFSALEKTLSAIKKEASTLF